MKQMSKDMRFIARTIYHHKQKTSEYVTLLVYQDSRDGTFELWDDREADHDFLAGNEEYVLDEWGKRNRNLVENDFIRDNMMGENKWQRFIT